jgi:acyl transferase domain-containing protein/NAD(P)-dependent dehydrogenase (short-subunit alcohol dehydrogenase family)
MEELPFRIIALTPAGQGAPELVVAADRAGCLGVVNGEIGAVPAATLAQLAGRTRLPFGLKLCGLDAAAFEAVSEFAPCGLGWLVLDAPWILQHGEALGRLAELGVRVIIEATEWDERLAGLSGHAALQVKGHEAGGRVGEETSFILLQKALRRQAAPVFVRGGIGMHAAAAVWAAGAAGIVLDDQLLLVQESPVAGALRSELTNFTGLETGLAAAGGENWRIFERPGFRHVRQLKRELAGMAAEEARAQLATRLGWGDPASEVVPLGQAAAFAADFAVRYRTFGRLAQALLDESDRRLDQTVALDPLGAGHGVAAAHGTRFPIVQGPMTRVSDVARFAQAVAEAGALPMLALALMRPEQVDALLAETTALLAGKPWGVGLLGFAPADLIHAQTEVAKRHAPRFALIAGGRPDQAKALDEEGVASYLHVPSPRLLTLFLEQGATRFVFEGRECGGHVGPLASFVLWDTMVSTLLATVRDRAQAEQIQVLFAGGVHDALSAAMVASLAAPLVERGIKIGVLAGTAYLFTREIIDSGAIVGGFQEAALGCEETVTLETGPGHASRAAVSPFAAEFAARRSELEADGRSGDEMRETLEALSLGRLRIASKAQERAGADAALKTVPAARQKRDGMFMIGQVATLRRDIVSLPDLHREISEDSHALLAERQRRPMAAVSPRPADIAIIGIAALLPGADDIGEFWENILDRRHAIKEIPAARWDWRLYFDEDRSKPDKIYSRWGGFLDDMLFDPLRFGIPPRALEAVDPLQLMTLEVVRRCLADAGLDGIDGPRERMSIILGVSGGAGDVGSQYGERAEMPRFLGRLDQAAAERLPQWTEDSFAGILPNVAAGRAANRFDLGGLNFTVDAACASSLAAVYQAVQELESGGSDLVITGGIDTAMGPFGYLCFSKTQALSPRGRVSTFDTSADGIVISEGLAVLALKRLADAERDGDRIYAVIKGVGGSSDGRARSMTAPHPDGQIRALNRAYEMAGYTAASVGLFEAHGTGTVAGDTAELETVTRLLGRVGAEPHRHAIGSVKTLIGHTKATAGAAGLVKAVLACHHKILPPHGDFDTPNARLTDPSSPLYLLRDARPWLADANHKRRASVSAFGFGGTNFHVALEEYDGGGWRLDAAPRARWARELLVWRGAGLAEVAASVRRTAELVATGASPELRDLAMTLARQAPAEGLAATLVVRRDENLGERLATFAAALDAGGDKLPPGAAFSAAPLLRDGSKLAMIFPGQGSQYPEMLRDIAVMFPEMRAVLEAADRMLAERMREKGVAGGALSRAIFPTGVYDDAARGAAGEQLTRTDFAQPALGAVEAGLLHVLRALGVAPEMTAGHSYGEFPALYAAGVLDLDELLAVSEARGRFMVEAAAGGDLGTMAAVRAERGALEAAIAGIDGICVANHNTPNQSALSGTRQGIEAAIARLSAAGMACQRLVVGAAFHSPIVAPARDRLAQYIAELPLRPAAVPVFANVSAAAYPPDAEGTRALLAEQLGRPVEFVREIEAMHEAGARVFLSVGPKTAHAGMVRQILAGRPHRAIACDDGEGGLGGLLAALGALLAEGARLDLERLWRGRDCRLLDAELDGAQRRPEPQSHMWWLNGGGAHRVGTPAPKPLTIEDVAAASPPAAPPAEPKMPPRLPVRPIAAIAPPPVANGQAGSFVMERSRMDPNEPQALTRQVAASAVDLVAPGDREAALAEFQMTMQRFLETQQNVMLAYLSGAAPTQRAARPAIDFSRHKVVAQRPMAVVTPPPAMPPRYVNGNGAVAPVVAEPPAAVKALAAEAAQSLAQASHPAAAGEVKNGANGAVAHAMPPPPTPPPANGKTEFGKSAVTDLLLGLVEDRTGYPRDMLGMDQNLEADLGIDSIKRVEIVGALLKALPPETQAKTATLGESLNGQKTLSAIIDVVCKQIGAAAEAAPRPFELTGADTAADAACARPPRFTMVAHAEEFPAGTVPATLPAGLYIVTADSAGLAPALAERIEAAGGTVRIVDADSDIAGLPGDGGGLPVIGLVHLAAVGAPALPEGGDLAAWRAQVERHEAWPHRLLRQLASSLGAGGRVLIALGLGGLFGRGATAPGGISIQGGGPGLVKCLRQEWEAVIAKAVDLDPGRLTADNARCLFEELAVAGGRIEIGYPGGRRTIFRTESAALDPAAPARDALPAGAVVLATGGARGITAETLRPLARPGATLVLAGRTALPGDEDPRFACIAAGSLRGALIKAARDTGATPTPAAIERQLQALLRDREIRANLADLQAIGARVVYRVADVVDPAQVTALIAGIYDEFGRLDGIIHGAGVLEDKLVVDKEAASWSRVVEAKALSAFLLTRAVRPQGLRFLVMFGSVAGRYGNTGQSDYAAANELLNRLAWQRRREWPASVKIAVLNWGPWAATRHGPGMVSAETRRKFEAKHVTLVEPEGGAAACLDEILRAPLDDVEVVLGDGPWESEETRFGKLPEPATTPATSVWPLLARASNCPGPRGGRLLTMALAADELFLDQHRLGGTPVLPAAVAVEIAAEAAAIVWPGWQVAEVANLRLLNGFRLEDDRPRELEITVNGSEHGDASGFSASVELRSAGEGGRPNYRASVRLTDTLPQEPAPLWANGFAPAAAPLSARDAYRDILFHGPCFQAVTRLVGLDESGIVADVAATRPAQFGRDGGTGAEWLFDPALIDAAAQLAWVWSCRLRGAPALPNSIGRIARFAGGGPAARLLLVVEQGGPPHQVRADVLVVDAAGRPVLVIETLESTADAALNRFRGWAGEIRV